MKKKKTLAYFSGDAMTSNVEDSTCYYKSVYNGNSYNYNTK